MVNVIQAGCYISYTSQFASYPEIALKFDFSFPHRAYEDRPYDISLITVHSLSVSGPGLSHFSFDVSNSTISTISDLFSAFAANKTLLISHDWKSLFFCLWSLGLKFDPCSLNIFDLQIAVRSLDLGRYTKATRGFTESIEGLCSRYNLQYPGPDDLSPFFKLQTLILNEAASTNPNFQSHLTSVEFPFLEANAWTEWSGTFLSGPRLKALSEIREDVIDNCETALCADGLEDLYDNDALGAYLRNKGLPPIEDFKSKTLERFLTKAPLLKYVIGARELSSIGWIDEIPNSCPRIKVHPEFIQNGAATGRLSYGHFPVSSLPSKLRPLVIAKPGTALLEFDFTALEPIVLAHEIGDQKLISAYQDGDIYSEVAKRIFEDILIEEELQLPNHEFKNTFKPIREFSKSLFLPLINGMRAERLGPTLNLSLDRMNYFMEKLYASFPKLEQGLLDLDARGVLDGYASIRPGLRRYIPEGPMYWMLPKFRNTPLQGTGASIFKIGLVSLYKAFQSLNAKVVLTNHDAYLVETPLQSVEEIISIATDALSRAGAPIYPDMKLNVEVNRGDPSCWNKAGSGSFDELLEGLPNRKF